jgi:ABC-type phosphate transport system substrate-binding protein
VINRESGSGTRATFEEKVMAQGGTLSLKSEQYMSNQGVLQAVATIDNGIGYVSLGYLPFEGACAVAVDRTECTRDTVFSGAYPMSRSLYLVTKGQASEAEKAFLYWCQNEGQRDTDPYLPISEAMEQHGYVPDGTMVSAKEGSAPGSPTGGWVAGSLAEGGSTTVLPLAEKWAEEYKAATGRQVMTNGGGSGTGARSCYEGAYDIGALSRDLYQDEANAWGLVPYDIAIDGIAIVVSRKVYEELGVTELTMEQLRDIYTEGSGAAIPISETGTAEPASAMAAVSVGLSWAAAELAPPTRRKAARNGDPELHSQ